MKRPLAYITAPWGADDIENTEKAAGYCRKVYEAGFILIYPVLFMPLFLNDPISGEHKGGIDIMENVRKQVKIIA